MSNEGGLAVPGAIYEGGHHPAPLPGQAGSWLSLHQAVKDSAGINTVNLPLGVTPYNPLPRAYYANRLWAIFGIAEAAADGSNYTQVEFRYGVSFASYTVLGSLNTQGNPAAGAPVSKVIAPIRIKPGLTLFAVVTKTGAASVNFNTERVCLGVDFQSVLVA